MSLGKVWLELARTSQLVTIMPTPIINAAPNQMHVRADGVAIRDVGFLSSKAVGLYIAEQKKKTPRERCRSLGKLGRLTWSREWKSSAWN